MYNTRLEQGKGHILHFKYFDPQNSLDILNSLKIFDSLGILDSLELLTI